MDYSMIAYIVISIFVLAGGASYLIRMTRSIAAGIFLIGGLLIFVFYGLRWFTKTGLKSSAITDPGQWPPIINPCPDYWQKTVSSTGAVVCEDTKNYYDSLSAPSPASSKFPLTPATGSTPDRLTVRTTAGEGITAAALTNVIRTNINLRWEGVYDGISQSARLPFGAAA